MTQDAFKGSDAERVFHRDEEDVRTQFRAAGHRVWIELTYLLGQQWESGRLGHLSASRLARTLSDLSRFRCRPDGKPLPASVIFECLMADLVRNGQTACGFVEDYLMRRLDGMARSDRSPAQIATLIEAFLRCFAADCERGEVTWVDELHSMVQASGPVAHWTLELPRIAPMNDEAGAVLSIPWAALDAAGLHAGDRLVVEPRPGGLWIARG